MDRSVAYRRRLAAVSVTALALLGAAACEPAPPRATFTVDNAALAHDAAPGDGVCEATPGEGDCTLNAAIDEANALGRGEIILSPTPDGEAYGLLDATITGQVELRVDDGASSDAGAEVGPARIHVAPGATLASDSISYPFGDLRVGGVLLGSRFALVGSLRVDPGGQAVLANAFLRNGSGPVLSNQGALTIRYSTVSLTGTDARGIETTGSGSTHLAATALSVAPGGLACIGTAPRSDGYNATSDDSCSLNGPTDRHLDDDNWGVGPFPPPGSPLRDAIPVGTLGCGTIVRSDIRGGVDTRPTDGDGDGMAACDIGAWEA